MPRLTVRFLALAASFLLLLVVPLLAIAQNGGVDGPSPAEGHAQVIAHGVAAMPAADVAWRVVTDTAETADDAPVQDRALGFVLADEGAIVVNDASFGTQARLAVGEAVFVSGGVQQHRASLGDDAVAYQRLSLVPAADAGDDGGDTLVFAGDGFAAPAGNRDLDLVRDVLAPNEDTELPDTGFPTLVLVTAGAIEVATEDVGATPTELAAGAAATFDGEIELENAGTAEAAFVAALIGPEVPAPPTPTPTPEAETASITVRLRECPTGYDGENHAADCPTPVPDVSFSLRPAESDEREFATTNANGVAAFELAAEELPGSFQLIEDLPQEETFNLNVEVFCTRDEGAETVEFERTDVERNAPRGGLLDVEAGDAIVCDWFNIPIPPPDDASLVIQGWICPAGYRGDAYYDDCRDTPLAGALFTIGRQGSDNRIGETTDAGGGVSFSFPGSELPNNVSVVTGLQGEGFADYYVNCTRNGNQFDVVYPPGAAAAEVLLPGVAPGETIRCDWFMIPVGSAEVAPCVATALTVAATWQGATGGLIGTVTVTNDGGAACTLQGQPGLQIINAAGALPLVQTFYDTGDPEELVTLEPGQQAQVRFQWRNWCAEAPDGPFSVVLDLPAGGEQVVGDVLAPDGTPLGDVPSCEDQAQDSTLAVGVFIPA